MSTSTNEYLENILTEVGGFGRFQCLMLILVFGSKIAVCWSTIMMTFGGAVPEWKCQIHTYLEEPHLQNETFSKMCEIHNKTEDTNCENKVFDSSMTTTVSQWELVCDREWIISTITTIQMAGLLIGSLISGQVSDIFGRKPAFFISIVILTIFNTVAAFSVSWQMFAIMRFFIGIGSGWFLTVNIIILAEYSPAKWRALVLAMPAWSCATMLFGLITWLLHDWIHLQIATAVIGLPWLLGFFVLPESYRWLMSNGKVKRAREAVTKIAYLNGTCKSPPSEDTLNDISKGTDSERRYTALDLLRNRKLLKITLILFLCELACGYGYYAISFGVQQLSGSLYVNIALLGLMDSVSLVVSYISNRIGRQKTTLMFFVMTGVTGTAVGVIQFLDIPYKGKLINGLALTSKLCLNTGWMALALFISELYPTVVRNVGFGMCEGTARFGAMIAPQLVLASKHIPGLSYMLLGGLFLSASVFILFLKETNKLALKDTIEQTIEVPSSGQKVDNMHLDMLTNSDEEKSIRF